MRYSKSYFLSSRLPIENREGLICPWCVSCLNLSLLYTCTGERGARFVGFFWLLAFLTWAGYTDWHMFLLFILIVHAYGLGVPLLGYLARLRNEYFGTPRRALHMQRLGC